MMPRAVSADPSTRLRAPMLPHDVHRTMSRRYRDASQRSDTAPWRRVHRYTLDLRHRATKSFRCDSWHAPRYHVSTADDPTGRAFNFGHPMTPPSSLRLMRAVSAAHAIAVLGQIVFAMLMVLGLTSSASFHGLNAWLVLSLGVATTASAWLLPWLHSRPTLGVIATIALLLEMAQISLGQSRGLIVHILIAMLIWAASFALMVGAWSRPPPVAAKT